MEESKEERGCKAFETNMQEYDELSSYRSMNFETDCPAQVAVPETVHLACIRDGKILACVSRNLQPDWTLAAKMQAAPGRYFDPLACTCYNTLWVHVPK